MSNGQQPLAQQQQPVQQQPVQQQSLYQTLGSMSPEDLLKFKAFYNTQKGFKQMQLNVGDDRAETLMSEVKAGKMTVSQAIDRSKLELSPVSRELNKLYFKKGITATEMLTHRERTGQNWTASEERLYLQHYSDITRKEAAVAKARIAQDAAEEKARIERDKTIGKETANELKIDLKNIEGQRKQDITNIVYARQAQTDYNNLKDIIQSSMKTFFKTDNYGNFVINKDNQWIPMPTGMSVEDNTAFSSAYTSLINAINVDLTEDTFNQSDQNEMFRNINVIANLVPEEYLADKSGFWIDGEFLEVPATVDAPRIKRKLFYDKLKSEIMRSKNHLNNIKQYVPETYIPERVNAPMINTTEEYEALEPGTLFRDPNGELRKKP